MEKCAAKGAAVAIEATVLQETPAHTSLTAEVRSETIATNNTEPTTVPAAASFKKGTTNRITRTPHRQRVTWITKGRPDTVVV